MSTTSSQDSSPSSDSANATSPPADATSPPADATSPPADATSPPANATSPPADATSPPADAASPTPSSETLNDITDVVQGASDALMDTVDEIKNMGLDKKMVDTTGYFIKDYSVLKSNAGSCNYWASEQIKRNPRMSQRLLTMRRGENTNNPQQRWRGHIYSDPSQRELKKIYGENNGKQYKAFISDFKEGRMNGGPVGGFDYAVCGEAHDEGKHGSERSVNPLKVHHDDIPTNPFTGDCLGVNETEFKKVIGEQKCKSAKQMKSEVEFLVCPPKIKDEAQGCVILPCPGSGKYKGMKMDVSMCFNKRGNNITINHPHNASGSQWECKEVTLNETTIENSLEKKCGYDKDCAKKNICSVAFPPNKVNGSFDALFNKKGLGTDGQPTVQWDAKSYLNRQSSFFSNYSPCLNFGGGGGDETSKSETGETIGGEGIFYDELELQNRRNAATFGWYNMVDSGFTQQGSGEWIHSGNLAYEVGDAVWVLVIPENENGETDGKMNARWLQGEISNTKKQNPSYDVSLEPSDLGTIPHPSRTRRPYPKDKKVLKGVHWKRLRRREKSDSSKTSPLDQIWLHSVCGKRGSHVIDNNVGGVFEWEDNHGIPRLPQVHLGCNGLDYDNHHSYDCYNKEKAYSTIPALLMQRYFQGYDKYPGGLGTCRSSDGKGNAMNRWIEWCHKYKQAGKSEERIVRNYLWYKPVGTYSRSYQDYVNPSIGNCGANSPENEQSTFNNVLEDWKTWGGVYPHTTMNPKDFGSTDGQGWGWYTGNRHQGNWNWSTFFNSTSAVSLLGHKTEKKINEGGDTLTEDGWSNRTPEFIREENSLKILGDGHNKDTRKSVGLTSCVKSSVGNGGKFPYLKRDRLIFDKNIRSNTLYPNEISSTTLYPSSENLGKGEGKEVGKGGMFRGCMRSPEDYDAKNILNCCITGKPHTDKIGNRTISGSCPMDYCVNLVRLDSVGGTYRQQSAGCSSKNPNNSGTYGSTQVCQAMSEQCVNVGEKICSNPDIQGDIEVEKLCKAWGMIQPTKYNKILDRKCLWFLDKTNPEAQKLNNLTKDNLSSSKGALISLYNTLGVGTSCAEQVRDSLDSPQTDGKMKDFCKGTVKQNFGLCIPVPKNQCRPRDPTNVNDKIKCIQHHGKQKACDEEKDETTKQSICRYTGDISPLPKTCNVKPGSSDPKGECKSLNGLPKKDCESNDKCVYKEPTGKSDNIYDICNNQKNDPMICEQHRDCMWVSKDKNGKPVNRLTPNNKPYWEKTVKGSLLSKRIENPDHLTHANSIPLDKPDSIDGFGFDICGCHYGKDYNDWYKKHKLSAGQGKDATKLVLNQPPQCWLSECSNGSFIPTSKSGQIKNICPNIIQCVQTQIMNTYTSGGLSRQSKKKAGSQSCTANLEITNVRGGNDLSTPEDEETAEIYDAVNEKIEEKSGIKNTKGSAKGGEKSTPKTTAEKEEAKEEESNTWIVFSIIGGVILLFIILLIILSIKGKK